VGRLIWTHPVAQRRPVAAAGGHRCEPLQLGAPVKCFPGDLGLEEVLRERPGDLGASWPCC